MIENKWYSQVLSANQVETVLNKYSSQMVNNMGFSITPLDANRVLLTFRYRESG
jgi:hypothetical protein